MKKTTGCARRGRNELPLPPSSSSFILHPSSFRSMRLPSFLFSALIAPLVHGDVTLPNIIGDRMVLQQEVVVPIWGEAAAGEKITVTLGPQQKMATADAQGRWMV